MTVNPGEVFRESVSLLIYFVIYIKRFTMHDAKHASFIILMGASLVSLAFCFPLAADMLAFSKVPDRLST